MFKFLLFILFFFFLLLLLMGFSVFRMFKRILFGGGSNPKGSTGGKSNKGSSYRNSQSSQSGTHNAPHSEEAHPSQRKKIFTKEEGEYVDYEDVR